MVATVYRLFNALITLFLFLVFIVHSFYASTLDPNQEARCLSCIRNVTTTLSSDWSKRCESYYCGSFQISYAYWADAGKPGGNNGAKDYEKCARDKVCSEQAVKAYFKKFSRDCNGDGQVDCLDMAALHKGGPGSCSADWFYKSKYWQAFNKTICTTDREGSSPDSLHLVEEMTSGRMGSNPMKPMANQSLTADCLDCICDAVSGCSTGRNNCGSGTVCGPFAISQSYWKDGRRPGVSWTSCTRTKDCSIMTVKNYMERHKRDCNGDGFITCEDYAAIHKYGPKVCINRDNQRDHYWNKFLACRASQKPHKDISLVQVAELTNEMTSRGDIIAPTALPSVISIHRSEPEVSSSSRAYPSRAPDKFDYLKPSTYELTSITAAKSETVAPREIQLPTNLHHILPKYPAANNIGLNPRPGSPVAWSSSSNSIATFRPTVPASTIPTRFSTTYQEQTASLGSTLVSLPATRSNIATSTQPVASTALSSHGTCLGIGPECASKDDMELVATTELASESESFNRVFNGIVTGSDLTKLYPPMPNQTKNIQDHASGDAANKQTSGKSTTTIHSSRSSNRHSIQQPAMSPSNGPSDPQQQQQQQQQQSISNGHEIQEQRGPDQPHSMSSTFSPELTAGLDERGLNESIMISGACLDCICDASSNCDTSVQCISKQREKNRCGLYMISWSQFQDSDIALTLPVSSIQESPSMAQPNGELSAEERLYYKCSTDKVCAERLINLYIEKYQKDCNNDGKIDCYDMAAIHRVGPEQCNSGKFLASQYLKDFNNCYLSERQVTTMTLL